MRLVKEHGAAVVALTIDEEGQARTAEHKVRIAERLLDDITVNWGLDESDIIIDALTFPISTGQEEVRRDGIETIEAIRELKKRHPRVHFTLGVSNISFGLNPAARQVLNSVFLHECTEAGLDTAIVHASKILPMARIPDEQRETALDLVYDRRREGYDPLQKLMELFEASPRRRHANPAPRNWRRCRCSSGWNGASSMVSAMASTTTSPRRWKRSRRSRSSTRPCCPA